MKRFTFQATTRGLSGFEVGQGIASQREKALQKAFEKWLKMQGLIIVRLDVIEQEDK